MDVEHHVKTVPLLIKHIRKLEINLNAFGKDLKAFGIGFDNVLVYGAYYPLGFDKNQKLKFLIDDGTGHICCKLPPANNDNFTVSLELDLQQYKTKNVGDVGKKLFESMERLLQTIKKQSISIDSNTKTGIPVAVLGVPYKMVASNEIWIHALAVRVESSPNRDTEIEFKNSLIEWYRKIYESNETL